MSRAVEFAELVLQDVMDDDRDTARDRLEFLDDDELLEVWRAVSTYLMLLQIENHRRSQLQGEGSSLTIG